MNEARDALASVPAPAPGVAVIDAYRRGEIDQEDVLAAANGRPSRYAGRVLNVGALLQEPDDRAPYIVDELVAPSALTVVAAVAGAGKSLLGVTFGATAERGGGTVAGIPVIGCRALVLDGEQGRRVIRRRLQALDVPSTLGYVDAGGLSVRDPHDQEFMVQAIKAHKAELVVADSLLRLSGGARENEDDMRFVMEGWANIARETAAGVLLIAHAGKDHGRGPRGHSTIADVADAVFLLERVPGDPEHRTRRRLRCQKMRIDEEPGDRWLQITSGPFGLAAAEPFDGQGRVDDDDLADVILTTAADLGPASKTKLADEVCGRSGRRRQTVFAEIDVLLESALLARDDRGKVIGPVGVVPGQGTGQELPERGREFPVPPQRGRGTGTPGNRPSAHDEAERLAGKWGDHVPGLDQEDQS